MKEHLRRYVTIALLAMILVAAAANMFLIWRVLAALEQDGRSPPIRSDLACRAVPISFVHDYPECTNRLLEAMNVTNVRIMAPRQAEADMTYGDV